MPAAFPGAYGWGAEATGGRGDNDGTVRVVTNTDDAGAGSFRWSVGGTSNRTVVFEVAGIITLQSPINIVNPNITIAGQTAPGSGIIFEGPSIRIKTHNVIMRYLRWRMTGAENETALLITGDDAEGTHDIMLDHLSFAWSGNDAISCSVPDANWPTHHITFQNFLFTESDPDHPTALLIGASSDSIDEQMHHVSVHKSLFSTVGHRNPLLQATAAEVINNVVYNWGSGGMQFFPSQDQSNGAEIDYINNYLKQGKGSSVIEYDSRELADADVPLSSIYIAGNYEPDQTGIIDPTANNWPMITQKGGSPGQPNTDHQRGARLAEQPTYPVPLVSALTAYSRVLNNAGANARLNSNGVWVSNIDSVDQLAIDDAEAFTGPGSLPAVPGTMPTVVAGTAYTDTDGDGMSDEWEIANGLDPNDPSDGPLVRESGYTNIENFLNGAQEEENGEGGGGSVPSSVAILGASSTPQRSLSENTEIDEFWEGYFRDIERAQNA